MNDLLIAANLVLLEDFFEALNKSDLLNQRAFISDIELADIRLKVPISDMC